jgi:hypothetical protein
MMKTEIKKLWVDALRSREYEQAQGYLRVELDSEGKTTGNCCLGVLCEIAVKNDVIERATHPGVQGYLSSMNSYDDDDEEYPSYVENSLLPHEVADWADLDDKNPVVSYDGAEHDLSDLNDTVNLTFGQIADLIEEQL